MLWEIDKEQARKKLVGSYQGNGSIRQTGQEWGTSRNVVRKWVRRGSVKNEMKGR